MIARTNRIILFFTFALLLCIASAAGSSCEGEPKSSGPFIRTDAPPGSDDDDSALGQCNVFGFLGDDDDSAVN